MNASSKVAIIGLGYVGLPLAVHLAERGHTVLGLDKDTRKIEKLSKLLSDLYKSSSLNIKSLITMGILNNITDPEQIGAVQKYIDNNLSSAWSASLKFKDKKVKPDKLKFTTRLLRNSSYK